MVGRGGLLRCPSLCAARSPATRAPVRAPNVVPRHRRGAPTAPAARAVLACLALLAASRRELGPKKVATLHIRAPSELCLGSARRRICQRQWLQSHRAGERVLGPGRALPRLGRRLRGARGGRAVGECGRLRHVSGRRKRRPRAGERRVPWGAGRRLRGRRAGQGRVRVDPPRPGHGPGRDPRDPHGRRCHVEPHVEAVVPW